MKKTSAASLVFALLGLGGGTAAHPRVPGGLWHEGEHEAGAKGVHAAFAERHGFLAVWRAGAAPARRDLVLDADWPGFQARHEKHLARGLRLVDLETYATPGGRRWAGLFRAGAGDQRIVANLALRDLDRRGRELAARGLLPVDVETWSEGGSRRWAGVFSPGKGVYRLTAGDLEEHFSTRLKDLAATGLGLADFEVYAEQGTPRYAGLFRAGEPAGTFWVGDAEAFHRRYHELAARGLRLADVETFRAGGRERYAALWRPGSGDDHLWVNACSDPCTGSKELARQAEELQKKREALPELELVDFETDLESGGPAGPGGVAAAAAPKPAAAPAARRPRPGQGAPAGPAASGDVTGKPDPPISHGRPLHDAGSTGPP